jgi:hypothetical protein
MKTKDPYELKIGIDGKWYAVFANSHEREEYEREFPLEVQNYPIASFGQYENAYCLGNCTRS